MPIWRTIKGRNVLLDPDAEGHKQSESDETWVDKKYKTSSVKGYRSFTIPNAKCPVCGTDVFYYENGYGSKVYFNSLGPPWPKHYCTDKDNGAYDVGRIEESDVYRKLESSSWRPCKIKKIRNLNDKVVVTINDYENNKEINIKITQKDIMAAPEGKSDILCGGSIAYLGSDKVISLLCPSLKLYRFRYERTK